MDVDSGPTSSKKPKSKNVDDLEEYNLDDYDEEEEGEPGAFCPCALHPSSSD
jgi:hypothetical protein